MIHTAPRQLTLEVTEKSCWGIKETLTMGGKRDVHSTTQRPPREVSEFFNRIRLLVPLLLTDTIHHLHNHKRSPIRKNVNDVRLCDWLKPRSPTSLVWIQLKTFVTSVSMFHFLPSLYCCYYLEPDRSSVWSGGQHCYFEPCIKDVTSLSLPNPNPNKPKEASCYFAMHKINQAGTELRGFFYSWASSHLIICKQDWSLQLDVCCVSPEVDSPLTYSRHCISLAVSAESLLCTHIQINMRIACKYSLIQALGCFKLGNPHKRQEGFCVFMFYVSF